MNHDEAVTKHHLYAQNVVDDSDAMYDMAIREYDYFEEDEVPFGDHPYDKGKQLGDIDVGLIDIENRLIYAKEIKTGQHYKQIGKAKKQLERIDDHFEDWTVIKKTILE